MNKFVIFLGGFVGGVIVGWKIAETCERAQYKSAVEQIRAAHDEDIQRMQKRMEEAENKTRLAEDDRAVFADALTRLGYTGKEQRTEPVKKPDPEPMIDEPYFTEAESSDPRELEIPTEEEFQRMEEEWNRPPELISQQTYEQDHEIGYEQKGVLWYPVDGVLLDEDNHEMMDDPDSFLGIEWREDIEKDTEYSIRGESYVRNYRWETDYFILKRPGKGLDEMSLME